jgi:hypothetical protein
MSPFPGGNARFDGEPLFRELLPEASYLFWFEHADRHFRTPEAFAPSVALLSGKLRPAVSG